MILALITIVLIVWGLLETYFHLRNVKSIPIRIHVNGIRGKSSVTRLIAAGLRAGGSRVFAKTTGSAPRLIYPDGREEPIRRHGKANIIEQLMVFRKACEQKADIIVIECMAVRPDFQKVCEENIVRSTIGVITNIRADHLDVMGPTLKDVAKALSSTLPIKGKVCYVEETPQELLDVVRAQAKRRHIQIVETKGDGVTNGMMKGFNYLEHRENVALALKVCEDLGVPAEKALAEMHRALPDPGVLRAYHFETGAKKVEFIDAFAANDPDSTDKIWARLCRGFESGQTRIILLNTRRDRIHRSLQLTDLVAKKFQFDFIFTAGENEWLVRRMLRKHGVPRASIQSCGTQPVAKVYRRMHSLSNHTLSVYAIGNIGGMGQKYVELFRRLYHQATRRAA